MRRLRTVGAALAIAMMLGACGGDEDPASADGDTEAQADSADDASDDDTDDSADSDSDGFAGLADVLSEDCIAIGAALMAPMTVMMGVAEDDYDELADTLADSAERVPAELRGDVATIADAIDEMTAAMADLGIDVTDPSSISQQAMADFAAAMESIDTPQYEAAAENLTSYLEDNCETATP